MTGSPVVLLPHSVCSNAVRCDLQASETQSAQLAPLTPAGTGSSDVVPINFAGPYERVWIIPALEEALGTKLPDANDPSKCAAGPCTNSCTAQTERADHRVRGVCVFGADTVAEFEALCHANNLTVEAPITTGRCLDRLIGAFLEPRCVQPTFLCGHPVAMSPLAKQLPDHVRGLTHTFTKAT